MSILINAVFFLERFETKVTAVDTVWLKIITLIDVV